MVMDDMPGSGGESFFIRPAGKEDIPVLITLINKLAADESTIHEATATPELLARWIFDEGKAEVVLGFEKTEPVGFALFVTTFMTLSGKPGLYLKDLFVSEEARGKSYGKQFLAKLAEIAEARGYASLEWSCFNWNRPSIQFCLSLGAEPLDDLTVYRLTGDNLQALSEDDETPT